MKRFLSALVAAAAVSALTAPIAAPQTEPPRAVVTTPLSGAERDAALKQASAALNAATRAQGRFVQVGPDGTVSQGRFWLQRPGRMRFEYAGAAGMTVISDGTTIAISDPANDYADRVPLRATPLSLVLGENVDLAKDALITAVVRDGDGLHVTARDRSGEADGQVTLTFAGSNLALARWAVVDGQGLTTSVSLREVTLGARVSPRLFATDAGEDPTARGRN